MIQWGEEGCYALALMEACRVTLRHELGRVFSGKNLETDRLLPFLSQDASDLLDR